MSERTGLGVVEVAILEALDGRSRFVKSATVLAQVEQRLGLAPGYGYEVLADHCQPWKLPVRVADGRGNFGSRGGDPPASFRYTQARMSAAGTVALAAERGQLAPLPIGLINGRTHRCGLQPPYRPQGVIDAIRLVLRRPRTTGKELIDVAGPPEFTTGCEVAGDLAGAAAGKAVDLYLQARVRVTDDRAAVIIDRLPPNANPDEVAQKIANRATIAERRDEAFGSLIEKAYLPVRDVLLPREGSDAITCFPRRGVSAEELRDKLIDVYGVCGWMRVALPRSLPALIRDWVRTWEGEDLAASLDALEHALASASATARPAR